MEGPRAHVFRLPALATAAHHHLTKTDDGPTACSGPGGGARPRPQPAERIQIGCSENVRTATEGQEGGNQSLELSQTLRPWQKNTSGAWLSAQLIKGRGGEIRPKLITSKRFSWCIGGKSL